LKKEISFVEYKIFVHGRQILEKICILLLLAIRVEEDGYQHSFSPLSGEDSSSKRSPLTA